MGLRDIHFGAFLPALAGALYLAFASDGAIASHVSYWDDEKQIEQRLEHLPATRGIVSSMTLAEQLTHAQPELKANLPLLNGSEAAGHASADVSFAIRDDMRREIHPGLIDGETLIRIPSMTSVVEHTSSRANASAMGPQGVAVPLPSSAWTGFTCLAGLAAFYFLKNVRRLLR